MNVVNFAPEPTTEPTPEVVAAPRLEMIASQELLDAVKAAETTPEVVVTPAVEAKPISPTAPVSKPKITNDELQISVKEFHAALGVPPSFRELNQQRLAAVVGEVKVSELKFDKATRDAAYLNQWMKWAISEYKKLALTSKR
jgi:hypothetical protein